MAHPKSKISKQRKHKRRTHKKAAMPQVATCKTTGEKHLYHRTYEVDGDMYYRGRVVVRLEEELD